MPKIREKQGDKQVEREVALFLRPPKGIAAKDDGKPLGGLALHYPRQAAAPVPGGVAGAETKGGDAEASKAVTDVYVAVAGEQKVKKDFAADVLRLWGVRDPAFRPVEGRLPAGATLVSSLEFDDAKASYTAYYLKGADTSVVVVFRYEKGKREAVKPALDVSLETLALDQEAGKAQSNYQKRKPRSSKSADPATPKKS